jgi:hypothetical protein
MSGQRYTPEFKDEAVRQVTISPSSVCDSRKRDSVALDSHYYMPTKSAILPLASDSLCVTVSSWCSSYLSFCSVTNYRVGSRNRPVAA